MPIIRGVDSNGHYYANVGIQHRENFHRYYFNPMNDKSNATAYSKALKQQKAIYSKGWRRR